MAQLKFSTEELSEIQKILSLKKLNVQLRTSWGSFNDNYRDLIHEELRELQAKAYPFFDSSISHCQSLGGFVFTEFEQNDFLQIGFDIELTDRVTDKISSRISHSPNEYSEAPSPASYWVAKEAAFKSLKGKYQPKTVGEIALGRWTSGVSQYETVRVQNFDNFESKDINGVVFRKDFLGISYHFSLFVARP